MEEIIKIKVEGEEYGLLKNIDPSNLEIKLDQGEMVDEGFIILVEENG